MALASSDLRDWNLAEPMYFPGDLVDIVFSHGMFVGVSRAGVHLLGCDDASWLPISVNDELTDVASGDGLLVAVGENGVVATSARPVSMPHSTR